MHSPTQEGLTSGEATERSSLTDEIASLGAVRRVHGPSPVAALQNPGVGAEGSEEGASSQPPPQLPATIPRHPR